MTYIPSYFSGFARNAWESEAPHLWRGKVGHWAASIGKQGQILRDVSGYGNHGTLTNMDNGDWVAGRYGYALDMDGSNDYIALTTNDYDFGANPFSITALVYNNTTIDSDEKIISFQRTGTNSMFQFRRAKSDGSSGLQLLLDTNTTSGWLTSYTDSNIFTTSKWRHVVVVKSGTSVTFYIDGSVVASSGSVAATMDASTGSGYIGARPAVQQFWNGIINDVRIYNRVLSANEVMQLYVDPFADLRLRRQVVGKVPVAALNISDFERGTMRGSNRGILRGVG